MKPIILLMLFPAFSWAWRTALWEWKERAQAFLENPLRQSRVPQVILDARHPWVVENQGKLEQLPDVEKYLCSLASQNTTVVNTNSSEGAPSSAALAVEKGLEIPSDLFDYLEIDNYRSGVSRPGWPNALLRLREISRCPAALAHVKTFKIQVRLHNSQYSNSVNKMLEPSRASKELLGFFTDVLGNMTSLETLKWNIQISPCFRDFEEHFAERGLLLPTVKTLETNGPAHFLVHACPNMTKLEYQEEYGDLIETKDWESLLVRATVAAPELTRLGLSVGWGWDHTILHEVVSYMPGLTSLGLGGELIWPWPSDSTELREIVQILTSAQNLTQLDLPSAEYLGVGWDKPPRSFCTKSDSGPDDMEAARRICLEGLEAIDRAADIVVEVLPRLTGLSIGDDQANITHYENGTARASFPWTGRMHAWVTVKLPGGSEEWYF
ncbi:hypothetical protein F4808DRAFT_476353 [Astrocystis sublimbata]|nr:hypothetical protein F4808DRAFT_476353 [Astrocystis sublimbata]